MSIGPIPKNLLSLIFALTSLGAVSQETEKKIDTTATTAQQAPKHFDLAFGDSLAEGMMMATGLRGDAKHGRQPNEILAAIKKYNPANIKGKNIVLSCGAANNPALVQSILPKQLAYLKQAGAKEIVVIGISDRQGNLNPAKINAMIADIVEKFGCKFAGPIRHAGKDNVHPAGMKGYQRLLNQAERALNSPLQPLVLQPAPAAPATGK